MGRNDLFCASCPPGGESPAQRRAGASHADWTAHGAGCELQELQQQGGLAVRVRHRGQPALQGGPGHPGEGTSEGERGLRTDALGLQLLNLQNFFPFACPCFVLLPSQVTLHGVGSSFIHSFI